MEALGGTALLPFLSEPLAREWTGEVVAGPGRGTPGWVEASVSDAGKAAGEVEWFCAARGSWFGKMDANTGQSGKERFAKSGESMMSCLEFSWTVMHLTNQSII